MKSIVNKLNEAREIRYRLAVNADSDMPIDVTILVNPSDQKTFEEWVEKEKYNTFAHGEGGNLSEF